jgi:hypothetical protein
MVDLFVGEFDLRIFIREIAGGRGLVLLHVLDPLGDGRGIMERQIIFIDERTAVILKAFALAHAGAGFQE